MNCQFKHPDGRWNIVEGTIACGRVACLDCGGLYPTPPRPMRRFWPNEYTIRECRPAAKANKLSAKSRSRTCPENRLLAAQKHLDAFEDEMRRAINKTTKPEHKQLIEQALDAYLSTVQKPDFKPLLANAIAQAVQEGSRVGENQG